MARTVWVGLHGALTRRAIDGDADAYQLFVARSAAMGWLTDAMGPGDSGSWGMNDAELVDHSTVEPPLVAWFQVALTNDTLPVLPLLSCIGDVLACLGDLELEAVQVLVPPASGSGSFGDLAQAGVWFGPIGDDSRCAVEIAVDGGQVPTVVDAAPAIVDQLESFRQPVATLQEQVGPPIAAPPPAILDHLWVGPPCHRIELAGTLVEWSLDAIGWTIELVGRTCHVAGVASPVLVTVRRAS